MTTPVIELRRVAGVVLAWAVLPFPFLYIVMPPFWLTAAAVAALLLAVPERVIRLSRAAQNALGVAILVAVVVAGGLHVGPLRPLGHLLLLLTSVRAVSIADFRGLVRSLPAIFLVWLVAVANTTHVSALAYLAVSAAVWWWVGMRVHLLGVAEAAGVSPPRGPSRVHVAVAAVLACLLAVPVFLTMPRLRSPWIAGRGSSSMTGFTSEVDLNRIGAIQASHQPALLMRSLGSRDLEPQWTRLRGTALDMVLPGSWTDRRRGIGDLDVVQGRAVFGAGEVDLDRAVPIEIELLEPGRFLFVPEAAVAVESPVPIRIDPVSGAVRVARRLHAPVTYTVWVADGGGARRTPPSARDRRLPERDPEIEALVRSEAGPIRDDPFETARQIERWLQRNFSYSMTAAPGLRVDPVRWFLFSSRMGHCEEFAATMVVSLRHLDIPARMVAGYSGGALSRDGREALVRQSNAHSWVEAWMGADRGWVAFDPTPPTSVPGIAGPSGMDRMRWAWQRFEAGFDRWVLTFGFGEQMQLVAALGDAAAGIDGRRAAGFAAVTVGLVAGLWWLTGRVRRRATATGARSPAARAVSRLARRLEKHGLAVPVRATPRAIGRTATVAWPGSGPAIDRLVDLAEHELYAPQPAIVPGSEVRRLWRDIRQHRASCPESPRPL